MGDCFSKRSPEIIKELSTEFKTYPSHGTCILCDAPCMIINTYIEELGGIHPTCITCHILRN